MKRFLSIVLALCMVFALCACGNDSNNGGSDADSSKYDKISIDLSCNGQSDTANDCIGANLFKQYIEEQSGGAITVTIYNNDQLAGGNMTKGLELVMDGTVQMDIHSTSIISSIDKRLMVSCLPWTFSDYQAAEDAFFGAGGEFVSSVLAEHGLTYLGALHNGFKCMTSSKCQIKAPSDLVGQKIRTPGGDLWNGFWSALGASPQAMSWSEVYTAMQQKTIDGQENGCSVTKSAKMDEIQQYMTIWNYSYENDLFVANSRVWESLDENTRQLLQECATESCEWGRDHLEAEEDQLIQGFMDSGMQVDILTEDQLQAFKDAVAGVTADLKTEYGEDACAAFGIN